MSDALFSFLKQKAKEFVLNEKNGQERSERFEVFCVIYDVFPEIEKRIFEDFKNRLISEIKEIDENFEIAYSGDLKWGDKKDKNEAFWIYKDAWKIGLPQKISEEIEKAEKWGFYYYIMNSVDWGSQEISFGLGVQEIGFESEHLKGASKIFEKLLQNSQFCKIVENIYELLIQEKIILEKTENWQEDFKKWGGIFIVNIGRATGWDPEIKDQRQRSSRRAFYREFLEDPQETVNKYINKFKRIYELTKDKFDELVEVCNEVFG